MAQSTDCLDSHLEGASGVLAMVKAILMVKNGVVLPTAGFEHINPKIEGRDVIRVLEAPMPWPSGEPKRVLVTNFGKPYTGRCPMSASV